VIDSVEIRNFQSLKSVKLELSKFTVIVGESSSGKSAFLRALKALATNPRTSSFVTYGQKMAVITAKLGSDVVTLEKGEGHTSYRLFHDGEDLTFTKLAGAVPEQVTKALGIKPVGDNSIDFASQFDRPFLLDDSGANVARVFGDLTNVSTIFEAVRESNRRKFAYSGTLKTRQKDIADIREEAKSFMGLKEKLVAISDAEALFAEAQAVLDRVNYLQGLIDDLEMAEMVLSRMPKAVELPDFAAVQKLQADREEFVSLIIEWKHAAKKFQDLDVTIREAAAAEKKADTDLHTYLTELGECPVCHQTIS
jgi:energy-coupling factor transporter ATP-binding protein EcfA2